MSKNHYIIPIFVPHKGCPHDCIFCNQKRITGIKDEINEEKVERIINQYLLTIPQNSKVVEVAFYGGSFTGISKEIQIELLSVAKSFKNKNLIHGIRLSTRPDYIDEDIADMLKEFGVTTIELGVQSMDSSVLKLSNRGHSREDVIRASTVIKKKGITLGLQMMVGLPGDTEETILYTADEIIALKPDIVRIYPTLIVKETALEILYVEGKYKPLELDRAVDICKKLLVKFESKEIQVIRVGLQPTDSIQEGKDIIAGPFHPAFRELVESRLRLDMIKWGVNRMGGTAKSLELQVNPKALSEVIGIKKRNINELKRCLNIDKVSIVQNSGLARDEIIISNDESRVAVTKENYYSSDKDKRF